LASGFTIFHSIVLCLTTIITLWAIYYEYAPDASKEHLMLEPTLRLAFGGEKVKMTLQGTYSDKLNSGISATDNCVVSIGISLKFGMPNSQGHPGKRTQPDIKRE
jgi:hypothetical protein